MRRMLDWHRTQSPMGTLVILWTWLLLLLLSRFSHIQLCDPIDGLLPGSPVPGILQARTLEWVAISFSSAWKWKVNMATLPILSPEPLQTDRPNWVLLCLTHRLPPCLRDFLALQGWSSARGQAPERSQGEASHAFFSSQDWSSPRLTDRKKSPSLHGKPHSQECHLSPFPSLALQGPTVQTYHTDIPNHLLASISAKEARFRSPLFLSPVVLYALITFLSHLPW